MNVALKTILGLVIVEKACAALAVNVYEFVTANTADAAHAAAAAATV